MQPWLSLCHVLIVSWEPLPWPGTKHTARSVSQLGRRRKPLLCFPTARVPRGGSERKRPGYSVSDTYLFCWGLGPVKLCCLFALKENSSLTLDPSAAEFLTLEHWGFHILCRGCLEQQVACGCSAVTVPVYFLKKISSVEEPRWNFNPIKYWNSF